LKHGSFWGWLDAHYPLPLDEWGAVFCRLFVFTGWGIVGEFWLSSGCLPGTYDLVCRFMTDSCPPASLGAPECIREDKNSDLLGDRFARNKPDK
jgi:hypothetical protein